MCNRKRLVLLMLSLHLYGSVISMDSNNSTPGALNNNNNNKTNTPVIPQPNISNEEKTDTVHLGEKDLGQLMKMCNESYQIPISNQKRFL